MVTEHELLEFGKITVFQHIDRFYFVVVGEEAFKTRQTALPQKIDRLHFIMAK